MLAPALVRAEAVVAQSYRAGETLEIGTLVSRSGTETDKVEKTKSDNRSSLVGVVIGRDESFVSYNTQSGTIKVATSGVVFVDVSTVNGEIKTGDQLSASPIAGFAMKASGPGKVIGRALQDFTKTTNGAQIRDVTDSRGKSVQVAIGQMQTSVQLSDWAGAAGTVNPFVDNLQTAASQLTGRQVNAANAMIAALVLSIAILVSGIVLFSSVSSSIHSLGRNPLSHSVIRRSLTQVILLVVALMIASVIVAYIIIGR